MRIYPGITLLLLLAGTSLRAGEQTVSSREELLQAARIAKPGDVLKLASGITIRGGFELREIHGTKAAPVILRAADSQKPPVFEGGGSGVHVTRCSYLTIDGLHLTGATGNGINVDNGGSQTTTSRGITLLNLVVSNVGPNGNSDGIKLSGLDDFKVENCRIVDWGTGGSAIDMVGCHDGVITDCMISRNPNDAKGRQQANGVQMKGGSARIIVRKCRFEHPGGRGVNVGGSTGKDFFRPADANYEAKDITVEDCQFIGGMAAIAFVGVDSAIVRHNTLYHPERWALRILQENRTPGFLPSRNGTFSNNIVVFNSQQMVDAVNISDATAPETFRFENNVWYCEDRPEQTQRRIRLPVQEVDGIYDTKPEFINAPTNLRIRSRSPIEKHGVR